MAKVGFTGLEDSGKSYQLSVIATELMYRNSHWYKITGIKRPLISNQIFTEEFSKLSDSMNVPIIYWHDVEQLIQYTEGDVLWDEIGHALDSRRWADLSIGVRDWLTEGSKQGIDIYFTAQDFAQVDLSFRRLVKRGNLYEITKIVGSDRPAKSKPSTRRIWGLCMKKSIDPTGYNELKKKFDGGLIPSFFFIEKRYCEIFNTNMKVQKSKYPPLKHIERDCEDPLCKTHKIIHV